MSKSRSQNGQHPPNEALLVPFESPVESSPFHFESPTSFTIADPIVLDIGPQKKAAFGSMGTQMIWPTRREGKVRVDNMVPIWDSTSHGYQRTPCTLIVPKEELTKFLRREEAQTGEFTVKTALDIWCTLSLWQATIKIPQRKREKFSLPVSPHTRFRLELTEESLAIFSQFFRGSPPPRDQEWAEGFKAVVRELPSAWEKALSIDPAPPWLYLCELRIRIALWLTDLRVLRSILHPPGTAASESLLTRRIERTLFIYRQLVQLSEENAEVREVLDSLLDFLKRVDQRISTYLKCFDHSPLGIAVALTERWFRIRGQDVAHLGKAGHLKSPREVFSLYANKGQNKRYTQEIERIGGEGPAPPPFLIEAWIREYLSLWIYPQQDQ